MTGLEGCACPCFWAVLICPHHVKTAGHNAPTATDGATLSPCLPCHYEIKSYKIMIGKKIFPPNEFFHQVFCHGDRELDKN